jgi:choline dehydrogenase
MILQPGSNMPARRFNLPLVTIMAPIGKPRGFGSLRFPSADPRAKPMVDNAFLEDERDRALAVDAMARAYALTETPPMKALASHFWPGPKVLKDRDRIDAWIRKSCDSGYHPCGTVPMGGDSSTDAATDQRGAVRGVEGLFVVDASLLPTIPSANIHLTVLMMAERISDWLRGQGSSA